MYNDSERAELISCIKHGMMSKRFGLIIKLYKKQTVLIHLSFYSQDFR